MPFVQAKCTECGGMLAVDDAKKAAVCQFCGKAFIVEEAIHNYITNNITNNTINNNIGDGAVVNVIEQSKSVPALLERVAQFLEDKDWDAANQYCDDILDIDPKNAQAYLGKLMAELRVQKKTDLATHKRFENSVHYQRAFQYGDQSFRKELQAYVAASNDANRLKKMIQTYQAAESSYQKDCTLWEDRVAAIKQICEQEVTKKLSEEKESRFADVESKYSATIDQLSKQQQTLSLEKTDLEVTLGALGFFAFSDKKNCKQRIAELTTQWENVSAQLGAVKQEYTQEKRKLDEWETDRRVQLLSQAEATHPLPPKPERAPIVLDDGSTQTSAQLRNQCIMGILMEKMEPEVCYERTDFQKMVSDFETVSLPTISAISRSMVEQGYLEKIMHGGETYFTLR